MRLFADFPVSSAGIVFEKKLSGMNKSKPAKSKQENPKQEKKRENTMALKIGKDTPETWRDRFYAYTASDPGDMIGTLLRGAANIVDETVDEETPMDVVFEILRDSTGHIAVQGMLSMQFSEMTGEVKVNDASANRLATAIYDWLKSDGKPRTKSEIEGKLFPGVVMKNNAQGKADLKEAYKLLYLMPNIARFAQNGDKTDTRWTTIQIVTAKPAPLVPPVK